MINRRFDQIEKGDIDGLVERKQVEHRTLDYKLKLPSKAEGEVREFLADVTSFANASGGDMIFGVDDAKDEQGRSTGIPSAAPGLGAINVEAEILRLENTCRDSITPRISGLHFRPIGGFPEGPVIILRIPKSFAAPHMIAPSWRFYSRNSAGKYPLDVTELRAAFVASEALPERIAKFRDERIARIVADETPLRLEGASRVVLHVAPISGFAIASAMPIDHWAWSQLPLIYSGSSGNRRNFDGVLTYDEPGPTRSSIEMASLRRSTLRFFGATTPYRALRSKER